MKIDTEIRHVTKLGTNLFLELGFPPDEAKRLYAASKNRCALQALHAAQRGKCMNDTNRPMN